ncbi:MAG: Inner membrane CreD family protein [Candidatus Falkowbacteria bacterium GW2011_GWC2_38_22]|uniref:Inner membrane CreD family protein n=1 Tax=Candidatus Falkowbacteria bacterium GW2011_GWE1_38_31 TaxID=1618638 RepID=A0A0G0M6X2_9BACT|nr:MAG: Inner membrane CreD family protein [Candidatus Falkowbacteria bacterium GW2011_GWF2_38_1205]KKQ60470.1 MAG: Inner membrane CreD family protein [Candidatus Falkowbacteria bacterium GW2011_GWC2_38_22]KKQ62531.1 MAG: Inner membrane CreD family protein [Candidatus Falkowbacteria bacterium GW2011_GWF1_38_22]KKQ64592.1 MAG: Inner membrane CreD family protein [Candidatus Falkowbacteria bacterium GW2011_GWE2_38_254]KKQ69424.1 MAG: Inner membrane CreD family protein [Candidatus Falkowbacteria ba
MQNIKSSLSIKLFVIGFLIAILMIPIGMIAFLANERENRQAEAFREVSGKWGNEQTITGPILSVPYKDKVERNTAEGKVIDETIRFAHFLPEELDIKGMIEPERRKRGIYEVAVYNAKLEINGKFLAPDFSKWDIAKENILYNQAFVTMGIPDTRGIKENLELEWGNKKQAFNPGVKSSDVVAMGVSTDIDLSQDGAASHNFKITLSLNGSRDIYFAPLGRTTQVELSSGWSDPSFQGAFLPENHTINEAGFTAVWKVLELNRSFPQKFLGSIGAFDTMSEPIYTEKMPAMSQAGAINQSNFGVRLLVVADEYQETVRALKYAIMLLALTFLVLFFYEAMRGVRVHPLQYILIGLALALFYLLLLSISEYLGFKGAYILSALTITALITLYSKSIFKAWRPALLEALILVFIYGFIFVILQLEDYSLLVGSLGLLAILSLVMLVSRKIDWYRTE